MFIKPSTCFAILAILATGHAAPLKRAEGVKNPTTLAGDVSVLGGFADPVKNVLNKDPVADKSGTTGVAPLVELFPGHASTNAHPGVVDGSIGTNSPIRIIPFNGPSEQIAGVNAGEVHVSANLPIGGDRIGQIKDGSKDGLAVKPVDGVVHGAGAPGGNGPGTAPNVADFAKPNFLLANPLVKEGANGNRIVDGNGNGNKGLSDVGLSELDINRSGEIISDSAQDNKADLAAIKPEVQDVKTGVKDVKADVKDDKADVKGVAADVKDDEVEVKDNKIANDPNVNVLQTDLSNHDNSGTNAPGAIKTHKVTGDKLNGQAIPVGGATGGSGLPVDQNTVKQKIADLHLDVTVGQVKDEVLGKASNLFSLYSPPSAFKGAAVPAMKPQDKLPAHTLACGIQNGSHDKGATIGAVVELCIPHALYAQRPSDTVACPADLQKDVLTNLLHARQSSDNDKDWDVLASGSENDSEYPEEQGQGEEPEADGWDRRRQYQDDGNSADEAAKGAVDDDEDEGDWMPEANRKRQEGDDAESAPEGYEQDQDDQAEVETPERRKRDVDALALVKLCLTTNLKL